jgi:hypothetical protein
VAPRTTRRSQPTTYHRDAGRERLARLTGWVAAGGIAGVGIFTVVTATAAPAKTPPAPTTVITPSTGAGDDVEQPATVPPTVPDASPAPTDPSSGGAVAVVPPEQVLQPPTQPPVTSSHRHHQDAAATTGGS